MSTSKPTVASLALIISKLQADIATLTDTITVQATSITYVEAHIDDLQAQIKSVIATVSERNIHIENLEYQVKSFSTVADETAGTVDSLIEDTVALKTEVQNLSNNAHLHANMRSRTLPTQTQRQSQTPSTDRAKFMSLSGEQKAALIKELKLNGKVLGHAEYTDLVNLARTKSATKAA
jgi:chromosome segregation ATPase